MITPLSGNETIHMPADCTPLTAQGRSFACLPRLRHLRMHTGSTLCRPKRKNAPESGEVIVELAGLPAGLATLEVRITCQNLPWQHSIWLQHSRTEQSVLWQAEWMSIHDASLFHSRVQRNWWMNLQVLAEHKCMYVHLAAGPPSHLLRLEAADVELLVRLNHTTSGHTQRRVY